MKKYLTKGLIIGLLMISCNEQNIQVKKERLPRITFTTLDKENLLNTALDNFGLTKSGNSSGRMMSGLSEFKSDSILKVLQADSTNYTYTLYLKGDKKDVAFRNLVFQRAKNGFYGFVLEYSSSDAILNVASTTGYVKKYDLEGRLLQETSLKNAKLGRDSKIGRAQACFADVTVECIKYKFGGWDHSTGVPFNECEEYGYIITINCSGGSGGGTGSTNSPGTYIPDPNPSTVVGAGGGAGTGGSTSGGTTNPPSGDPSIEGGIGVIIDPSLDIKNQTTNPCLNSVVANLLNGGFENHLSQGLQRVFDKNSTVNLYIRETSDSYPGLAGTRVVTDIPSLFNVEIVLNINSVPYYSREGITRILLHEVIHAQFLKIGISDDQVLQHTLMLKFYIDWMRDALIEIYPSLPSRDATALALQGYADLFTTGTANASLYNQVLANYGFTRDEMVSLSSQYKLRLNGVNLKGTTCN